MISIISMSQYTKITPVLSSWPFILLAAAIGLFLGVVLSFLRPLEYSSTVRILITQELGAVDAYTASLSVERIADDLSDIVYTTSFYDKVMDSGYDIDESYFDGDENKRRKKWNRTISTAVSRGSGLLTVKAYHTNVEQARNLVMAVASVLIEEGWTYTSGSNITVQLVDAPLDSKWPVRPNIFANAFAGFVLGIVVGIGYILIQAERLRRRHQLVFEE
ncbi:hypothetical protein D6827_02755 [Candidatus Parcubacteria bacterium]|nr:MAG: hypothetical protein D6827_02755 [Candidatus Parcubacteria bacterium]